MEAFKTRLMQEYVELNERTEKLEEFILKNPKFESLETEIQTSMLAQKEAMKEYRHSLKHRMKLLGITHDDVVAYKHPYQNLSSVKHYRLSRLVSVSEEKVGLGISL